MLCESRKSKEREKQERKWIVPENTNETPKACSSSCGCKIVELVLKPNFLIPSHQNDLKRKWKPVEGEIQLTFRVALFNFKFLLFLHILRQISHRGPGFFGEGTKEQCLQPHHKLLDLSRARLPTKKQGMCQIRDLKLATYGMAVHLTGILKKWIY